LPFWTIFLIKRSKKEVMARHQFESRPLIMRQTVAG
jgi:hypothetical protein